MKSILIALSFFVLGPVFAQKNDQPKLSIRNGLFSTQYKIGEKRASEQEMILHLEKTSAPAYYHFRLGKKKNLNSTVCLVVGSSFLVYALLGKNEDAVTTAATLGLAFDVAGISFAIGGNQKQKRAVSYYNAQFGY